MERLDRLGLRPLEDDTEHLRLAAHVSRLRTEIEATQSSTPAESKSLGIDECALVGERPQRQCRSAQTSTTDDDVGTIDQQSDPGLPAVGEEITEQDSRVELHAHVEPVSSDDKLVSRGQRSLFSFEGLPVDGLAPDMVEDAENAPRATLFVFGEGS